MSGSKLNSPEEQFRKSLMRQITVDYESDGDVKTDNTNRPVSTNSNKDISLSDTSKNRNPVILDPRELSIPRSGSSDDDKSQSDSRGHVAVHSRSTKADGIESRVESEDDAVTSVNSVSKNADGTPSKFKPELDEPLNLNSVSIDSIAVSSHGANTRIRFHTRFRRYLKGVGEIPFGRTWDDTVTSIYTSPGPGTDESSSEEQSLEQITALPACEKDDNSRQHLDDDESTRDNPERYNSVNSSPGSGNKEKIKPEESSKHAGAEQYDDLSLQMQQRAGHRLSRSAPPVTTWMRITTDREIYKISRNSDNEDRSQVAEFEGSTGTIIAIDATHGQEDVEQPTSSVIAIQTPRCKTDISSNIDISSLSTYFQFLFAIGQSTYRGAERRKNKMLYILQMITFVFLNTLAFMDALKMFKYYCFRFADKRDLEYFVTIGHHAFHCLSAVYFVKFAAFDSKKISSLIDIFDNKNINPGTTKPARKTQASNLAIIIGVTSLVMAFISTLFRKVNMADVITAEPLLQRSFEITHAVFIWDMGNYSQRLEEINTDFATDVNLTSVSIGLIGFLMEVCGTLQHNIIRDLMLLSALILHQLVTDFKTETEALNSATSIQIDTQLRKFKHLQCISEKMTNALGVLLFANFFLNLLNSENYGVTLLLITIDMAKTSVTYVVAAKTSRINQYFPKWIHEQRHESTNAIHNVGRNEASTLLDLDELKRDLVGLGNGMAFISVAFIVKFFGYVASCFLFFAKHYI